MSAPPLESLIIKIVSSTEDTIFRYIDCTNGKTRLFFGSYMLVTFENFILIIIK